MKTSIKQRRQSMAISQGELAIKAGISRRKLEYMENDTWKEVNLANLSKIATALGCNVMELLNEEDITKLGGVAVIFIGSCFI